MISFGANLIINNNIYNRLETQEAKDTVTRCVEEYRQFIEHPKVEAATEQDTIELRRGKYRGYSLELEITGPELKEPYVTGIYTSKKEPSIKSSELVFQTLLFLCFKKGEKPRYSESIFGYVDRVLFDGKLRQMRKQRVECEETK